MYLHELRPTLHLNTTTLLRILLESHPKEQLVIFLKDGWEL